MQNRLPRLLLIIIAIVVVIGIAMSFFRSPAPSSNPSAAKNVAPATTTSTIKNTTLEFLPQEIFKVTPIELKQTMALSGALRAVDQASVKARVAAEVREVLVREGESVTAGQILVRMDTSEFQARVDQAKGNLHAMRAQLDIATKNRDNNRALLDKGFISRAAFDNTASQFAAAQANVESAQGALDIVQKLLNDSVVRAPISGLIAVRNVQPGEKVSTDYKLLDIVNLKKMECEALVPTSDISKIKIGQSVLLHIEGLAEEFIGNVTRINPATQAGSRSIAIYIQVANPQDMLKVGMFVDAQLVLRTKANVIAIPQTAVHKESSGAYVYALENNLIVRKNITLGQEGRSGEVALIEITSGLNAEDQIVKTDMGNLRPGTPVRMTQVSANK
jgi:membrane fusion protein, multidrug efflux system